MRRVWIIPLLVLGVTLVGWRLHERRAAARQTAVERSLLRQWALTQTDLGRSAPEAGISLERRHIRTLDEARQKELSDLPGFRQYQHRCESCHGLPDPTLHEPSQWAGVVDRMGRHMQAAGVFELSAQEWAGIVRFLETAAMPR